jgi:hypothetical protein
MEQNDGNICKPQNEIENPEDSEPDAKVLAQMLEDMVFLGLTEFKASDPGAAVDLRQ